MLMPASPTVRRRRLAAELRRLREDTGLTIDNAAAAADISKSALSRIENSLVPAKPPVVRALIHAYKVSDTKAESLLALARDVGQAGWWNTFNDVTSAVFSVFIGFEAEASSVRSYEAQFVPGLLQTREYMTAIFGAYNMTTQEIERRTEVRLRRQDRINEIELWFIIEESVLRRPVGGHDVMQAQLSHMLHAMDFRNLTLQVLPESVGAHPGLEGAFGMLEFPDESDPAVAYIEGHAGQVWLEKADDIARLTRTFDRLRATALSERETQILIRRHLG
jgi:transcriptional regulator with XRE-family HTH domain